VAGKSRDGMRFRAAIEAHVATGGLLLLVSSCIHASLTHRVRIVALLMRAFCENSGTHCTCA
jgi:hypothetical protein